MSNNLKKMEKDLRAFAKRSKDVKYTKGLLFSFLLMGMLTFSDTLTSPEVKSTENAINQTRKELNTSISEMHTAFKQAKRENNRLLKRANLELIQLMEQGDHVVKSPWSSWQMGMNYFYSNWRGTYKGRGDKAEKYPYEGILERDSNEFNRYVSPDSKFYGSLPTSSNPRSAASNARQGLSTQYGIASTQPVPEPIVDLQLSAGINPKIVNKADLNLVPKSANVPNLPEPVKFQPINPKITIPADPPLPTPPNFAIVLGGDCNSGCDSYDWRNGGGTTPRQNTKSGFTPPAGTNQNVTNILHYTWRDGLATPAERSYAFKMLWEAPNGSTTSYKLEDKPQEIFFNSYNYGYGRAANGGEWASDVADSQNIPSDTQEKNHQYFLIGGSRVLEVDNVYSTNTEYGVASGRTLQLGGIFTLGVVSQENGTILVNEGTITDEKENQDSYIRNMPTDPGKDYLTIHGPTQDYQISKNGNGYVGYKVGIAQVEENEGVSQFHMDQQRLQNRSGGKINFFGNRSIGMYVYLPRHTTYAKMENQAGAEINMSGAESYGMRIAAKSDDAATMLNAGTINLRKINNQGADTSAGMALMLDSSVVNGVSLKRGNAKNTGKITLTGVKNSIGAYVNIDSDITNEGTISINSTIAKNNDPTKQEVNVGMRADKTATAEVINEGTGKITMDGSYAMGMLANGSKLVNKGTISSTNVLNGVGIAGINNAKVKNSGSIKVLGSGNTNNIGVFLKTNSEGEIGTPAAGVNQEVEVTGDNSTGVLVSDNSKLTMNGNVTVSGKSVSGVVVNNGSQVTSNGGTVKVDNSGNHAEPIGDKGSYGIVVKGATSKYTGATTEVTAKVTSDKSMGLYSEGKLEVNKANIDAKDGAINFYANGGEIKINNGGNSVTGQKSLLFYTAGAGKFNLAGGTLSATIKGGTTPSTRGTAFYYEHTGPTYGSFDTAALTNFASTKFQNTLNHLNLTMEAGSRLFVASNVEMNLSDTNPSGLVGALNLGGITGSDYKVFMLYLSRLKVNQAANLDDANDLYNKLEIANSSITNENTMTGSQNRQVAMAQENGSNPSGTPYAANKVTLINEANGKINLTGEETTGMYAKRGVIENNGEISVGKKSTAIYSEDDDAITAGTSATAENKGKITLGEDSTGIYYKNGVSAAGGGAYNQGKIESSANNVIGMTFDTGSNSKVFRNHGNGEINLTGDKSTAMYATGNGTYTAENNAKITLGNSSDANNPNVGMFTDKSQITLKNTGTIAAGDKTAAMYGYGINTDASSDISVGSGATGIYSKGGNVHLRGKLATGGNEAVGVYTVGAGQTITNDATNVNIGDGSYGFVIKNAAGGNNFTSNTANVTVGNNVVYAYSTDTTGTMTNNTKLNSTGNENYGLYGAGTITNNADIDFGSGIGSVGIYSIKGGTATNTAGKTITIGASNVSGQKYGIGMAAGYENSDTGKIINKGTINVNGKNSIGMYATGNGSVATNDGTINLGADGTQGMYLDNGAKGINNGTITTVGNPTGAIGVTVRGGAEITNNGTININSSNGYAFALLKGGIIKNYGTFTVGNGAQKLYEPKAKPTGKGVAGVEISAPAGASNATITVNGKPVTPVTISSTAGQRAPLTSSIGMYIDTLRGTNPIGGLIPSGEADLIIGSEAAQKTNSKYIEVNGDIIKPYNQAITNNPQIKKWNIYSGSFTWIATATIDTGAATIRNIYLAKKPYTAFAGKEPTPVEVTDTYNFLDGLEQRYGVEGLETREKTLFNKLNGIGTNEQLLFYQATDEMMGHQYANVQQRMNRTGTLLDKEFTHLRKEWDNKSKQSNKLKVFGMRDEYKTDTAGIIDYTSNAYGVAYIHEDETIKLGNSSGWYAGAVNNRFRFKDIGRSKENTTMLKLGLFKSKAFDDNGSLNWTISGEGYIARSNMHRKFLVVDEIFEGKSDYTSYGAALKNEISKEFRTSERTSIKPYGSLKLEYGRFNTIKEKTGEVRLEVKGNDYYSVKPEVGIEFKYKQPMAVRTTFTTTLGLGYETELGKVGNVKNKGRVAYTDADWFNIRGEKDDRRGNFKADLNLGIENQRFGVTLNAGYDTKGKNIRGGLGFRVIY
ncbi:autotransporter-associated N-terminal domain-containing protein [Pseudoleptotrichia goodfellowii]|uniref:Outer membrane protein n=1 Tax=Pseudoleptotrichia goodfellowii TaxID=157692 RepID=A0A510JF09_9FUSO|nr:autotransporter-associated N-terminal domain-containing protein [Pseudoleptotrichia goodfellowii]BBM36991.1 outer membrane protein [Pseudoleptotrichia goodfellowii]